MIVHVNCTLEILSQLDRYLKCMDNNYGVELLSKIGAGSFLYCSSNKFFTHTIYADEDGLVKLKRH